MINNRYIHVLIAFLGIFFALSIELRLIHNQHCHPFERRTKVDSQSNIYITPENTEIAWDIHGVLMHQPISKILNNIEYGALFALFPPAAKGALLSLFDNGLTTKEQIIIKKAFQLLKSGDISGEGFYWLFKNHGFEQLAAMTRQLADAYCPYPGIIELIQELDRLGYTQRIASNIGSNFYKNLQQVHPKLFSYFKGGTTVYYQQEDGSINFDPIRKPNKDYIGQYNIENASTLKPQVILIDDRISNVAGLKDPWITIAFTSVAQLRKDLIALGLPLNSIPNFLKNLAH